MLKGNVLREILSRLFILNSKRKRRKVMEKERYRFINDKVYELNSNEDAYEYLCNFIQADIKRRDSISKKNAKADAYVDWLFENGHYEY